MRLNHVTKSENVSSIIEYGLLRSYSRHWRGMGGCIYLSKIIQFQHPEYTELLLVDVAGLNITQMTGWEFVCWEDIPPDRITIAKVPGV